MTRLSSSSGNGRTRSASAVAAIARTEGVWRLVILSREATPRLVEAIRVGASAREAIGQLESRGLTDAVAVVPASACVTRLVSAPGILETGDAVGAMPLIAEAHLPESIPSHRRSAGLLRTSAGEPRVLVVGWAEPLSEERPESSTVSVRWMGEVAALASLMESEEGLAVTSDRTSGSIAILHRENGHISARSLRGDTSTDATWRRAVDEAVRETAPDRSDDPISVAGLSLSRSRMGSISRRVRGVPVDPAWFSEFGSALGAALLELDADEPTRTLASMTPSPRIEPVPGLHRVARWIGTPTHAIALIVVAGLLLVWAPVGVAWARNAILSAKAQSLDGASAEREETSRLAALYRQFDLDRRPMTKLMADIASAAPVTPDDHVRVTLFRLSADQGVLIEGVARSATLATDFQKNLSELGVLRDVRLTRTQSTAGGVEFSISAEIGADPHRVLARPKDHDFAALSLAERLYGEGTPTLVSGGSSSPASSGRSERPDDDRPSRRVDPPENRTPTGAAAAIPPAISDADIASMDRSRAMMAFAERSRAVRSNPDLPEADKQRLDAEIVKLKARMDATRGGGS